MVSEAADAPPMRFCRFKTFVHSVHNVHFRFTVSSNCLFAAPFQILRWVWVDDILVIVRKNDNFLCFFYNKSFFFTLYGYINVFINKIVRSS